MYTIKSLTKWDTHEGGGFQLTLLRDGKPIAQVTNEGNGGDFRYVWKDGTRTTVKALDWQEKPTEYNGYVEEAALWAHVMTLPRDPRFNLLVNPDMFVEDLVNDLELERQVKRWLKQPTAIVDGKVMRWKAPTTEKVYDAIRKANPGIELLNELPLQEAVARVKALQD